MSEVKKQAIQDAKAEKCRFKGVADSGSPIADVWTRVYDDNARRYFVKKTGQINLDETIQESKNAADIAILKKQYELTGQIPQSDPSLINGADLVGVPQNIHELYDFYNHAEDKFNSLPEGLRKAFGGVQGFINAINGGTVHDVYIRYIQSLLVPKKPEQTQQQQQEKTEGE